MILCSIKGHTIGVEVAADLFGNSSSKLCCHFEYFKIDVDHSCTRKVF